jgi:hypothetical protein
LAWKSPCCSKSTGIIPKIIENLEKISIVNNYFIKINNLSNITIVVILLIIGFARNLAPGRRMV